MFFSFFLFLLQRSIPLKVSSELFALKVRSSLAQGSRVIDNKSEIPARMHRVEAKSTEKLDLRVK